MQYRAYNLTIESDIPLPSLHPSQEQECPDITIARNDVPADGLADAVTIKAFSQAKENCVWFNIPDIARYQVSNGNGIDYQPYVDADEQSVRLYLLGSCLGAVLHQRGNLVLHASAIRIGEGVVLLAGRSGVGKSTTAAVFHQNGYEVIADDVVAINPECQVVSGSPQIKLWQDALENLQIDHRGLKKIRYHLNKYNFPLKSSAVDRQWPLRAVYILGTQNMVRGFQFEELQGIEKFNHLKAHTYRQNFIDGLGLKAGHLKLCGKIAGQIAVTKSMRPDEKFNARELAAAILKNLERKGFHDGAS